jgi:hypothetical protein
MDRDGGGSGINVTSGFIELFGAKSVFASLHPYSYTLRKRDLFPHNFAPKQPIRARKIESHVCVE